MWPQVERARGGKRGQAMREDDGAIQASDSGSFPQEGLCAPQYLNYILLPPSHYFLSSTFLFMTLFSCHRAATTKYHRLGGLSNRNALCPSSGGQSEIWCHRAGSLRAVREGVSQAWLGNGCLLPVPLHVTCPLCTSLCPNLTFSWGHQSYRIRAHLKDLALTWLPLWRSCLQIRS